MTYDEMNGADSDLRKSVGVGRHPGETMPRSEGGIQDELDKQGEMLSILTKELLGLGNSLEVFMGPAKADADNREKDGRAGISPVLSRIKDHSSKIAQQIELVHSFQNRLQF